MFERQREIGYVLSTPVDVINWNDAISNLVGWGAIRKSAVVCICNVHMVVTARQDNELNTVLSFADMVTPDGAPVAWALRRMGAKEQPRVNGPDLMWRYLKEAERLEQVVSFFGGREDTLFLLREKILCYFPKIRIGKMISPPFREVSENEDASYVREINDAGTSVLFVGLGCPKQEKWMLNHRGKVKSVMIGVGAAFDYHAGSIKRAPMWMQVYGLEWLYRLISEPKRLWRRYLITNTLFIFGMALEGFRARRNF